MASGRNDSVNTESSDVEELELVELKRPAVDEEQYNKVFTRPYAAPSLPSSRSDPDVLTSHLDVNFDEKDYTRHRKTSAKYHEPLRRIHSHHNDLSSLARKEARKHKKHKHRQEHKDDKNKFKEKSDQGAAKLPGIKETREDSSFDLKCEEDKTSELNVGSGGDDDVDSEVCGEEDTGLVLKIKSKPVGEPKAEVVGRKAEPEGKTDKPSDKKLEAEESKKAEVVVEKKPLLAVKEDKVPIAAEDKKPATAVEKKPALVTEKKPALIADNNQEKKGDVKKAKVIVDDPGKVRESKAQGEETKPTTDIKDASKPAKPIPKRNGDSTESKTVLQADEKLDSKEEKAPDPSRKRRVGVVVIDNELRKPEERSSQSDDEEVPLNQEAEAEIEMKVLYPREKVELSLVEVLPPIDEGVVSDVRSSFEKDDNDEESPDASHHTDKFLAQLHGDRRDVEKKHHHHRRRKHHHRHPSNVHRTVAEREAIAKKFRIRSGALTLSETEPDFTPDLGLDLPTEKEEAVSLEKRDLEEIAWHRFEDLRGLRRRRPRLRKPRVKSGMLTRRRGSTCSDITASIQQFPIQYDHSPHEAFIELQELTGKDQDMRWRETARWIKFEEDVEDSNRWGKPHVASLTFHSLLELRKGLEKGTVLLDLEKFDLLSISEAMVENMVITDQISREKSDSVLSALLVKHKHQYQETGNLPRRPSFYNLMSLTPNLSKRSVVEEAGDVEGNRNEALSTDKTPVEDDETDMIRLRIDDMGSPNSHTINMEDSQMAPLCKPDKEDKEQTKPDVTFAPIPATESRQDQGTKKTESDVTSRIPTDAEATNVLVGTLDCLKSPVTAFVRLAKGCYLGNVTEVAIPVRFIFVMLGPDAQSENYHEIGRSIATLMSDQVFHDLAYYSESREDLLMAINEFLEDTVVLPPGEWDRQLLIPVLLSQSKAMAKRRKQAKAINAIATHAAEEEDNPLKRTGRFCGGLVRDIKHRAKVYLSDFKDGFNLRCLMVTIFLYFAVFAPNIAFGGLLAEKTDQWLGVSEVIFASCLCGIVFGLFAGQPLIIIGATGPVLVFEQTIYQFCKQFDIEFLPWRCWIGLWVLIILFLVVAFEGCFLVRYFSRFTEEVFACLISIIFIYEAINFLFKVFKANPLSRDLRSNATSLPKDVKTNIIPVTGEPNTALLSAILLFGTYFVAYYMRKFRHSHFFGRKARRIVSDFGILFAMTSMVIFDVAISDNVLTPKISVGDTINDGFRPTLHQKRGWFINPIGLEDKIKPGWVFAAVIPALFVGILLFMETELTGVLLNKKENCLQKEPGFNMDLLLMGVLTLLCSLFGLPWMCAATVRSVSHFNALSVWSTSHAPGERPYLMEVKEQRVTNIMIHVLTGFSILLAPALHLIPVPVLFGVLLYLGLGSLSHIQLVDRLIMMLMPPKHHPDVRYVRKVQTSKIHWFTVIQLVCLIVLMIVKLTAIAPAFPFFIICLIPIRRLLTKIFTEQELEELDNEEGDDGDSDFDEYDMILGPI